MAQINFWNTLATQDIERARAFYTAIGFAVRDTTGGGGIVVQPNEAAMVCIFPKKAFAAMIPGEVCDATRSQEIIQSIAVGSREAVDAFAANAKSAGGRLIGQPKDEPWGYGLGFEDPDGHVWSVLYMGG